MVTLKALEAAIAKVERIRDHEYTFEAGETTITLRPLRPDEETEVQRYAQVAMEGETNQAAIADFMDRMRHATLGFSIVQLGSVDLRNVEYVETGEVNDAGVPVSIPKWEAVRDKVAFEWSRTMLSQVFTRFGELLERMELRASKVVKFDPVDVDEEIGRVERRLADLRALKKKASEGVAESPFRQQQRLVTEVQQTQQRQRDEIGRPRHPDPVLDEEVKRQNETPVSETPSGRRSAIPTHAGAPERSAGPTGQQAPPPREATDQRGIPLPHEGDSFFDPADPDAALAAESRRQVALHQQQQERKRQQEESQRARDEAGLPDLQAIARDLVKDRGRAGAPSTSARVDGVTGGLRAAANLSNAVFDGGAQSVRAGRPAAPVAAPGVGGVPAQLHGRPVFKMPAQTLERSETPEAQPGVVNPEGGARNPRFRGPTSR